MDYSRKPNPKKSAIVYGRDLRVSPKSSVTLSRALSGKSLDKGKKMLMGLIVQTRSLNGKYYTKTAGEMMRLLGSAEHNAEFKGLDPGRLMIFASAHKGFGFWRPRNWKRRREKRKMTNIQIVLEER